MYASKHLKQKGDRAQGNKRRGSVGSEFLALNSGRKSSLLHILRAWGERGKMLGSFLKPCFAESVPLLRISQKSFFPISFICFPKATEERQNTGNYLQGLKISNNGSCCHIHSSETWILPCHPLLKDTQHLSPALRSVNQLVLLNIPFGTQPSTTHRNNWVFLIDLKNVCILTKWQKPCWTPEDAEMNKVQSPP